MRLLGAASLAAAALGLLACSPGLDFPAVHDMPSPRVDAPLNPDQVKQATDDLISQRDHLSAEAQSNTAAAPQIAAAPPAAAPPVVPAAPPPPNTKPHKVAKKKLHEPVPLPSATAAASTTATAATQTAGAAAKP
jgi:hypothetical protein